MTRTIPGGELTPSQAYSLACTLANISPPQTTAEAAALAKKATEKLKTRADLLAKALPFAIDHATCLRVLVALHGAHDWYDWTSYAKRFASMPPGERESVRGAQLVIGSMGPFDATQQLHPFLANIHRAHVQFLAEVLDIPAAEAQLVFERITFRDGGGSRAPSDSRYSKEQVLRALDGFLTFGAERQVLALVSRVPVVNGKRAAWPSLSTVRVQSLLSMPLANREEEAGFGEPGWIHLGADLAQQMETYGIVTSTMGADGFPRASGRTPVSHEKQLAKALSMGTRIAIREASGEMLKSLGDCTVLEALTSRPDAEGFYSEGSTGALSDVIEQWRAYWRHFDEEPKPQTLANAEPFESYHLTVLKFTRPMESEGERFEDIQAVLCGDDNRVVAKISIGVIVAGNGSAHDFLWATDEVGEPDVIEAGLSFGIDFDLAQTQRGWFKHVAILRNWEVCQDLRGRRLGKAFLEEVVRRCFKGNAKPLLALRLAPAQFEIPILSDWTADEVPELTGPTFSLRRYWDQEIASAGGVVDKRFKGVFHYPHAPLAWADDRVVLFMLGNISAHL